MTNVGLNIIEPRTKIIVARRRPFVCSSFDAKNDPPRAERETQSAASCRGSSGGTGGAEGRGDARKPRMPPRGSERRWAKSGRASAARTDDSRFESRDDERTPPSPPQMDTKERTGKTTTRQKNKLDHHFLMQREFEDKAAAAARKAKNAVKK